MRSFLIERDFVKGMPHSVEYGLPGACDEVYAYAVVLAKSYANLEYEISTNKLCKTDEGGSSDSPEGVDMTEPNCGKPKAFEKATDESKFVKAFEEDKKKFTEYAGSIEKACASGPLGNVQKFWGGLELYENNILVFRDKFKSLGYEIKTKDPLEDKPKSVTEKVGDTVTSILWGLGLLVGGFFVVDYVYDKRPSGYVGGQLAKRT